MAARRKLVLEHLENISWRVMEDYPDVIRDMIRGKSGVYALYRGHKLYYVGLATNLMVRVKQHLKDRHKGAWNRFSVYITRHPDIIKELESLMLRIMSPPGNIQSGRLRKSDDLRRALRDQVRAHDDEKRAKLMGGRIERVHRRRKTSGAKGAAALKGCVSRSVHLRGEHDGWVYSAKLRPSGEIYYDGELYSSPTAAAKGAGVRRNGWVFWYYRDSAGEWVRLKGLKG